MRSRSMKSFPYNSRHSGSQCNVQAKGRVEKVGLTVCRTSRVLIEFIHASYCVSAIIDSPGCDRMMGPDLGRKT